MPRTYTKKTDGIRTPLDVLTRANEAVVQGGNYTKIANEFSIERMKLKHFIRKEKLQGPATSAGYEYMSRFKRVFSDRQENDLAEHMDCKISGRSILWTQCC